MAKTKGKHAGGRPKLLKPEDFRRLADDLVEYMNDPKNFWLKAWAFERHNRSGTWTNWLADQSPEFAEALKMAKEIQEYKLLKLSLDKRYNAAGAIFALKNVAAWRDELALTGKLEHEHSQKDPYEQLAELLRRNGIGIAQIRHESDASAGGDR